MKKKAKTERTARHGQAPGNNQGEIFDNVLNPYQQSPSQMTEMNYIT